MLIDQLLDLEKFPAARQYGSEEYNLDRYRAWLDSLGAPHRNQIFLHIAGTKGKGSTAAICEALLASIGFPTALYSSPHLQHYGERYRFDGTPWTLAQFEERLQHFHEGLTAEQRVGLEGEKRYRTVFEILTALAFSAFRDRGRQLRELGIPLPQVVVLETGLGGRLDCTNVVEPAVAVITALGIDHAKTLGDTVEAIAREKAGIIKQGHPVVVARQPDARTHDRVWPVIIEHAAEAGAPVVRAWEHNPVLSSARRDSGQDLSLRLPGGEEITAFLPLRGDFQHGNVEAAVAAVWYLARSLGVTPSPEQIARGLADVRWPGRMELHTRGDGRRLLLDGAHCPLSARCLGRELTTLRRGAGFTLLFGMQRDKDARGFLSALRDAATPGTLCRVLCYPVAGPRAADPRDLAALARELGLEAEATESIDKAFSLAMSHPEDLLVAGSLYCLATFRRLWIEDSSHA